MIWLFMFVLTLSLYDLRTRRIPNWATLPLILAGLVAHFPASPEIWLASLGLFLAWTNGSMGAGDAKLWIALLWALPTEMSTQALPLMFLTFLLTGLLQFAWGLELWRRVWVRRRSGSIPALPGMLLGLLVFLLFRLFLHSWRHFQTSPHRKRIVCPQAA